MVFLGNPPANAQLLMKKADNAEVYPAVILLFVRPKKNQENLP